MGRRWEKAARTVLWLTLAVVLAMVLLSTFPVLAGGNLSITRTINVTEDAYLDSSDVPPRHYNYGGSTTLTVMSVDKKHIVLRTNLQGTIPTGSNVTDGALYMYYSSWSGTDPVGRTYYVDRLTETDWVEGSSDGATEVGTVDWVCRIHGDGAAGVDWTTPGGTYTSTDEATGTVPSSTGTWMSITVTALTQYAITNGVSAEWVIRDPGTPANRSAHFDSSEGTNVPYLSVTFTAPWDSYNHANREVTDQDDDFQDTETTVYMKGTGFAAGNYNVAYYDATVSGGGNWQANDENIAVTGDGILNSEYALDTDPSAVAGTWHALVQPASGYTAFSEDSTYNTVVAAPDTYGLVANDSFNVAQSAIPEFPTALTAIVAIALCCGIYFWMRTRTVYSNA